MVVVIGHFRIPLEHKAEGSLAMARVIAASRAEPGCLAYAYAEDVLEPGLYRVSEAWQSREALRVHFAADHMQAWREERAVFGMMDRKVVAYEVGEAEDL